MERGRFRWCVPENRRDPCLGAGCARYPCNAATRTARDDCQGRDGPSRKEQPRQLAGPANGAGCARIPVTRGTARPVTFAISGENGPC